MDIKHKYYEHKKELQKIRDEMHKMLLTPNYDQTQFKLLKEKFILHKLKIKEIYIISKL